MAEQVRSRLRHPSALVVTGDSLTQGTFCKLFAALIAEKIILRRPAAYLLILPQDRHHLAAKRDDLNLLVFIMTGDNLMLFQIHITIFDHAVSDDNAVAFRNGSFYLNGEQASVFTADGKRVNNHSLTPGVYLLKAGDRVIKRMVK